MDAVEYIKALHRLCKTYINCNGCPLRNNGTCIAGLCDEDGLCDGAEKAVPIVEQWAKDHPVKTRQSEFLKMFPNAAIYEDDGILCIKPCIIDESIKCTNGKNCDDCRREYWLAEVTNND